MPINLVIESAAWRKIPKLEARLQKAAAVTLEHLPAKFRFPVSANLLLTSDAAIRKLNRDFRGKDKPTNVLSFPQFEPRQLSKMGKEKVPVEVGDIVIAYQYMVVQAKENHKILLNHVIHLMIHGLLHLFGYDHISNSEAGIMERLEQRIMKELGLPDPYKELPVRGTPPKKTKRKARNKRTRP
ncbi:MAG TPA: rRNA maturation RNase YbeY [Alphaproteobacteria bacterium]|nr:rRNA maturation RNase YbeY [Alphaproteobacteria bacterium]